MHTKRVGGNRMVHQKHLALLKQGVQVWNQWRKEHAEILPDLSTADLSVVMEEALQEDLGRHTDELVQPCTERSKSTCNRPGSPTASVCRGRSNTAMPKRSKWGPPSTSQAKSPTIWRRTLSAREILSCRYARPSPISTGSWPFTGPASSTLSRPRCTSKSGAALSTRWRDCTPSTLESTDRPAPSSGSSTWHC